MQKSVIVLLASILLGSSVFAAQAQKPEELEIAGIPIKVISEHFSSFKTEFIEVVIPTEKYSRENLEKVCRYYCEKYPITFIRLDLRIYTSDSYEHNLQFAGLPVDLHAMEAIKPDGTTAKLRSYEAIFLRARENEVNNRLLNYCPDPNKPTERVRVVLAGEDPWKRNNEGVRR